MFILCKRIECPFWQSGCQKHDDTEDCHMMIFEGLSSSSGKDVCFETATLQQEDEYRKFNEFYLRIDRSFSTKVPFPKQIEFVKL